MKATGHQPEAQKEKAADAGAESQAESRAPFAMPKGYQSYYGVGGAPIQLRKAVVGGAPSSTDESSASPLPGPIRSQMEKSFATDFSDVRVREGGGSTGSLGAEAFTKGNEITFAPGRLDTSSQQGQELIGHELAHVVQQREGRVSKPQAKNGDPVNADPALEHEADELGARAARGAPAAGPGTGAGATAPSGAVQLKQAQLNGALALTMTRKGGDETKPFNLTKGTVVDVEQGVVTLMSEGVTWTALAPEIDTQVTYLEPQGEKQEETNPHVTYPGFSSGFLRRPTACMEGSNVVITVPFRTRNKYDRLRVVIGDMALGASNALKLSIEDPNPAWGKDVTDSPHYKFKEGFKGLPGSGPASADRIIKVTVARDELLSKYRNPKTVDQMKVQLGIDMKYGGKGPTVAPTTDSGELFTAYEFPSNEGHQAGFNSTSSPGAGKVEWGPDVCLELKLGEGKRLSGEDFWKQDIPDKPPNNVQTEFPEDYVQKQNPYLGPLVPKGYLGEEGKLQQDPENKKEPYLKLQTRIENEATLKVSTREKLGTIVQLLAGLRGKPINAFMHAGSPMLQLFDWTLEQDKPEVFLDRYLDDRKLNALRAGVGIRKRESKSAAKLNVKTGEGYHVGKSKREDQFVEGKEEKSDIYRRHEIGFSVNRGATDKQIGQFLQSGLHGQDPWNKGAEQAQSVARNINFEDLQTVMVLLGYRSKFQLKATNRESGGVIGIEISCDHSVGCKPEDFQGINPLQEGFNFSEFLQSTNSKIFKEAMNVEMELDHLGVGGAPSSSGGSSGKSISENSLVKNLSTQPSGGTDSFMPGPKGFPDSRLYLRDDSESRKFNTPSFEIFYFAHEKLSGLLRSCLANGNQELREDKQKLVNISQLLYPEELGKETEDLGGKEIEPTIEAEPRPPMPEEGSFYDAALRLARTDPSLPPLLKKIATSENPELQKRVREGGGAHLLFQAVCMRGWRHSAGDPAPFVLAQAIGKSIRVLMGDEEFTVHGGSETITLYLGPKGNYGGIELHPELAEVTKEFSFGQQPKTVIPKGQWLLLQAAGGQKKKITLVDKLTGALGDWYELGQHNIGPTQWRNK